MLFNFSVRPLEDLVLSAGEDRSLSWYAMTDGSYWLALGDQTLFQYTEAQRAAMAADGAKQDADPHGHVAYYVIRLLLDVLDCLPAILEPVPAEVMSQVATLDGQRAWLSTSEAWLDRQPENDDNAAWDVYYQAIGWWGSRKIDTGYLTAGPDVWVWQSADRVVHIRWDSRHVGDDGSPYWTATTGERSMPLDAWVAEVQSFYERLMAAMDQHLERIAQGWTRPGVTIDVAALRRERDSWNDTFSHALAASPTTTDWGAVARAIATIQGATQ